MKKSSLNFVNRLERLIFKNFPENYVPVSSTVVMSALIAAFAAVIVIFFLQMFGADESMGEITLGIALGLAFLFSAWVTYKAMAGLPTAGSKVALAAYVLVLFTVCAVLSIWLAVWVVIVALVGLVGWLILKFAFPDQSKQKKGTINFSDGSSKSAVKTGQGILGEEYWEDSDGNTHKF